METYDYEVLAKEDFMVEGKITTANIETGDFDLNGFSLELSRLGGEGFRVITKLYNAPDDWVLLLSRPLVTRTRTGRTYHAERE